MTPEQLSIFDIPPKDRAPGEGGGDRPEARSGGTSEVGPGGSPATPSPSLQAIDSLEALAAAARECRRCGLRAGCRGVVFGEGAPGADVLFLGEGPGAVEDEMGRPFVGPAGQLLDRVLLAVDFQREDVYITNIVLCRPPGNRAPRPDEVAACRPWLERRLDLMKPSIIVCLGASSAQALLGAGLRITRDRGRWHDYRAIKVMPTFHPAALLRDPSKKRAVWEDMKAVRNEWRRIVSTGRGHASS